MNINKDISGLDPNDSIKISFTVDKNSPFVEWVNRRISELDEYDPGFYVVEAETFHSIIYQLHTTAKHLKHEEFDKFIFQIKLKLGQDVKIR